MDEPLENLYFNWLYSKVVDTSVPRTPSTSYSRLLHSLHNVEFVWTVIGDDNRAEGGLGLRDEFLRTWPGPKLMDPEWYNQPCSVLEMLIAFSYICEFETEGTVSDWFWIMLSNLELADATDGTGGVDSLVREVCDALIWRTYEPNGHGGLFPLLEANEDQRQVEIWYQFCAYLVDQSIY